MAKAAPALCRHRTSEKSAICATVVLGNARIVFSGMSDDGTPQQVRWEKGDVSGKFDLSYSVFDGGYLIFKVLDTYADFWHDDLVKRGEVEQEAPPQIGADGWPVEGGDDG